MCITDILLTGGSGGFGEGVGYDEVDATSVDIDIIDGRTQFAEKIGWVFYFIY